MAAGEVLRVGNGAVTVRRNDDLVLLGEGNDALENGSRHRRVGRLHAKRLGGVKDTVYLSLTGRQLRRRSSRIHVGVVGVDFDAGSVEASSTRLEVFGGV